MSSTLSMTKLLSKMKVDCFTMVLGRSVTSPFCLYCEFNSQSVVFFICNIKKCRVKCAMKCVYIVQVMFKNYIKNIVYQINHSLHCYFVVCWIPIFVGKHGSHKNGTGVFATSILRSKKNQMLLMFYPKNKVIT